MLSIESHKIYKDFYADLPKIARKLLKAEEGKHLWPLSEAEEYIFNVFHKLNEIDNKFKDLELSLTFISSFPNYKTWRAKMTREAYITYHLEYYHINIIAIFDRILHLVNFLYNLGLHDRYVTLAGITTNSNIPERLKKQLQQIDKNLISLRSLQNKVKHKNKLRFKELYNASLLEFNLSNDGLKKTFSAREQKYLKSDMNHYYKEFIKQKKEECAKYNEDLYKELMTVLDIVYEKYLQQRRPISSMVSSTYE